MRFTEMREQFYKERKTKGFKKKYPEFFDTHKPMVTKYHKGYHENFDQREELIRDSKLVLGVLVMANTLLYEADNNYDCPAVFLYSTDPYYEENIQVLEALADEIYSYRELPDIEILRDLDKKWVVDRLNKEEEPIFNEKLPYGLTEGREVYLTTMIVMREYIPGRVLQSRVYPLLIKEGIKMGMLFPSSYNGYAVQIRKKLKQRAVAQTVVPILAVLAILFTDICDHKYGPFVLIGMLVVFTLINWRCPHCNKYLGKGRSPKYCPRCEIRFK
ncbi:MAG: hypothetical protein ACRDDX_08450 [Cellulosilyticaceae bacterium]